MKLVRVLTVHVKVSEVNQKEEHWCSSSRFEHQRESGVHV